MSPDPTRPGPAATPAARQPPAARPEPAFLRHSGFVVEQITGTRVTGRLEVGPDQHTPWGIVHGGVYATAAEGAASLGACAAVADQGRHAVGVTNTTDFLRPMVSGRATVLAEPVMQGRTQQLWQVTITGVPDGKLIARSTVRLQNLDLPTTPGRPHPPREPGRDGTTAGNTPPAYRLHGLHHAQLAMPAGAEPQVRSFYTGVLGMKELPKPPALAARGGCWFRLGGLELHLGVEEDFRPARKAHPGILVGDLDALAARLAAHDVPVVWDDTFPGRRRCYAADPLGNRLEFLESTPDGT